MAGLDPAILFVPPYKRAVVLRNAITTRRWERSPDGTGTFAPS
jgi:hypothetical protein